MDILNHFLRGIILRRDIMPIFRRVSRSNMQGSVRRYLQYEIATNTHDPHILHIPQIYMILIYRIYSIYYIYSCTQNILVTHIFTPCAY